MHRIYAFNYDDKNNPFYNLFETVSLANNNFLPFAAMSHNNVNGIAFVSQEDGETFTETETYTYTYNNKNYPTSKSHEMTFGDWIMTGGSSTGNGAVWVSPVTGLTEKQISENPAFSGVWSFYRDDEQGKLYAETASHRDSGGNVTLPDNEIISADNVPVTVFDLITPNSVYKLRDEIYLLGEADGDGQITINDVSCIQSYLASVSDGKSINLDAAHIDSNGVDITDATQIQRYLAGFDVTYTIGEVKKSR